MRQHLLDLSLSVSWSVNFQSFECSRIFFQISLLCIFLLSARRGFLGVNKGGSRWGKRGAQTFSVSLLSFHLETRKINHIFKERIKNFLRHLAGPAWQVGFILCQRWLRLACRLFSKPTPSPSHQGPPARLLLNTPSSWPPENLLLIRQLHRRLLLLWENSWPPVRLLPTELL